MKGYLGRAAAAIFLGAVLASSAHGQTRDPLYRLEPSVRYAVEMIIDSARLAGLPIRPIESKALEGISKNKPGRLIVVAARNVFRSLRDARAVLGPRASVDELSAAGSALNIGVSHAELAHLARSRNDKPLTVPLVVLVDLISRGVPRDTASQTIFQLWQRGAGDEDFDGLWRRVEKDIVSGTDPGAALLNRAREIPSRAPPVSSPRPD